MADGQKKSIDGSSQQLSNLEMTGKEFKDSSEQDQEFKQDPTPKSFL